MKRSLLLIALAAAVLVVFVGAASAFGTVRDLVLGTTEGSRIAFTSFRNGSFDLYVMNADGSGQRNLTRHRGHDSGPEWSPDRRKIAFATKQLRDLRDGREREWAAQPDAQPCGRSLPLWSPAQKK
jgi:dipeptidyl aminopeptidase/acylaminoacyl peptidase